MNNMIKNTLFYSALQIIGQLSIYYNFEKNKNINKNVLTKITKDDHTSIIDFL